MSMGVLPTVGREPVEVETDSVHKNHSCHSDLRITLIHTRARGPGHGMGCMVPQ
jgi:hypothetical protein